MYLYCRKNAKVASDPESSSARPQTARSVAVAPPAAQPERPVSAAQRPASSAPRSSTPVLTSHTPHVSNKVMLPPLTVPTSSADNPTEQIAMSQSIPPIEPTATKSGSRPVTPSSRPASGTAGGSRPASGSKQTQDHSRTATPVKNEGQTPLDGCKLIVKIITHIDMVKLCRPHTLPVKAFPYTVVIYLYDYVTY